MPLVALSKHFVIQTPCVTCNSTEMVFGSSVEMPLRQLTRFAGDIVGLSEYLLLFKTLWSLPRQISGCGFWMSSLFGKLQTADRYAILSSLDCRCTQTYRV
ncbi:hypothetical protein ARMGADRAFT_124596 [Armillaria gallica]|uniref:Uncharacterized protein n=1 Tax=Armillaria gallica TaxID=47427 RepID=A0A2H3DDV3_ARMGA|nr:hypothetical protein ARMGADRAFT_124596 [Armillaria gallica]